ncbi:hypothetical protein ISS07_02585 [Candidatus Woesearchaeota archaeon]|nr:hypothetical protein [Candidatus Woesearchaeota archaeon]
MVIKKITSVFENRRRKKAEDIIDKQKLESYQQTEEMHKAESIKASADRLLGLKQYEPAIIEYKKALECYPYTDDQIAFRKPAEFYFKTYHSIALCFSRMNDIINSVEHFDKALSLVDIETEARAEVYMAKGKSFLQARKFLDESSKTEDKNLETIRKMDDRKSFLKHALESFTKITEIDKNNAEAWYYKGHTEMIISLVKEAMLSFDNVISLNKSFPNKEHIEIFDNIKREKRILVEEDDRKGFKTKTGHLVRNKAEKIIADFLFDNNFLFQYNLPIVWADKECNVSFFIPKHELYLEHFKKKHVDDDLMRWKLDQYTRNKKNFAYTTYEDELDLEESLKIKLKDYLS